MLKNNTKIKVDIPKKFGITYAVENTPSGTRKFHFKCYIVSLNATELKIEIDEHDEIQVSQKINGVQEEIIPKLNVYDENNIGKTPKLDKAKKVAEIFALLGEFIAAIGSLAK